MEEQSTENEVTSVIALDLLFPQVEGESEFAPRDYDKQLEHGEDVDFDPKTGKKKKRSNAGYKELTNVKRAITNAVQAGVADIAKYLGNLKKKGRSRFATKAERDAVQSPEELAVDCFRESEIEEIRGRLYAFCKSSGTTSYVYSPTSQRLFLSEFSGKKRVALLLGDTFVPAIKKVPIVVHNEHWHLETETVEKGAKVYQNLVLVLPPLIKGHPRLRLVCKTLRPSSSGHFRMANFMDRKNTLDALAAIPKGATRAGKFKRGQLMIKEVKRPGLPPEWKLLISYSKIVQKKDTTGTILVIHRGVANMLSMLTISGEQLRSRYVHVGTEVVAHKAQFHARRSRIAKSLSSTPHAGRGKRYHFRALAKIAEAEARAVQTHLHRAAKAVEKVAVQNNVGFVIMDDFGPFKPDMDDDNLVPYVRHFPYADLATKIKNVCKQRLGVEIEEETSAYISQRCPACGHTEQANVTRLPKITSDDDARDGSFVCKACGLGMNLDQTALVNLALKSKWVPDPYKEKIVEDMKKQAKLYTQLG